MSLNFERLTNGLSTKSEKIRTLGRAGASTSEIARFLDIRYQHARNVLVDAGLHGGPPPIPVDLESKSRPASQMRGRTGLWAEFDSSGALAIPQDILKQAGFSPGDRVFVAVTSEGIEMLSRATALRRAQKIAEPFKVPGVSLVDDFIAGRRKEWGEDAGA